MSETATVRQTGTRVTPPAGEKSLYQPLVQLTLVRFREFLREPEALFWVFVFPILLAAGLGIAFRNRPAEVLTIATVTPELAQASAALAMNQGLYNGFLAAGLVWGVVSDSFPVRIFFLGCVVVAGVFGALTAKRSILYVQGIPAAIAMAVRSAGARVTPTIRRLEQRGA